MSKRIATNAVTGQGAVRNKSLFQTIYLQETAHRNQFNAPSMDSLWQQFRIDWQQADNSGEEFQSFWDRQLADWRAPASIANNAPPSMNRSRAPPAADFGTRDSTMPNAHGALLDPRAFEPAFTAPTAFRQALNSNTARMHQDTLASNDFGGQEAPESIQDGLSPNGFEEYPDGDTTPLPQNGQPVSGFNEGQPGTPQPGWVAEDGASDRYEPESDASVEKEETVTKKRQRKETTCGNCGQTGHTKANRKCPMYKGPPIQPRKQRSPRSGKPYDKCCGRCHQKGHNRSNLRCPGTPEPLLTRQVPQDAPPSPPRPRGRPPGWRPGVAKSAWFSQLAAEAAAAAAGESASGQPPAVDGTSMPTNGPTEVPTFYAPTSTRTGQGNHVTQALDEHAGMHIRRESPERGLPITNAPTGTDPYGIGRTHSIHRGPNHETPPSRANVQVGSNNNPNDFITVRIVPGSRVQLDFGQTPVHIVRIRSAEGVRYAQDSNGQIYLIGDIMGNDYLDPVPFQQLANVNFEGGDSNDVNGDAVQQVPQQMPTHGQHGHNHQLQDLTYNGLDHVQNFPRQAPVPEGLDVNGLEALTGGQDLTGGFGPLEFTLSQNGATHTGTGAYIPRLTGNQGDQAPRPGLFDTTNPIDDANLDEGLVVPQAMLDEIDAVLQQGQDVNQPSRVNGHIGAMEMAQQLNQARPNTQMGQPTPTNQQPNAHQGTFGQILQQGQDMRQNGGRSRVDDWLDAFIHHGDWEQK